MSITETVLIFVGLPALAVSIVAIAVLAPLASRSHRYRPGTAWTFPPVWYLPHPQITEPISSLQASGVADAGHRLAVADGSHRLGAVAPVDGLTGGSASIAASGGASGEW